MDLSVLLVNMFVRIVRTSNLKSSNLDISRYQAAIPRGRHSQGPPFPASVVIFRMLMLLRTKEVLINKKLG